MSKKIRTEAVDYLFDAVLESGGQRGVLYIL